MFHNHRNERNPLNVDAVKLQRGGIDKIHLQQPVNRLGFLAGHLTHPLGCPSGRRTQCNLASALLQQLDDGVDGGGFSGARASGQDEDLVAHRLLDRFFLQGGVVDAVLLFELFDLLPCTAGTVSLCLYHQADARHDHPLIV